MPQVRTHVIELQKSPWLLKNVVDAVCGGMVSWTILKSTLQQMQHWLIFNGMDMQSILNSCRFLLDGVWIDATAAERHVFLLLR